MSDGDPPEIDPPASARALGAESADPDESGAPTTETSGRPRLGSFSTGRPVAVLMVFLAAVVFGFFSYERLAVTLMPELSYPTLTVRTEYAGSAPEEVENDISRPIEEALGVVSGLSRISSISRAGVSDVVLEFSWDTDMSEAIQDTLEKLDLVFLPEEAERPLILRFDPSLDPVLELSLSGRGERFAGEEGLRTVRRIAELQVRRALEPIPGVAAVRLRGGLEEEIHVLVDEEQLRRTNLSIQRVIDRLRQENVNVAGGTLKEGRTEYMVRTLNEYQNLRQIADTVITQVDGRDVRVRDVARVVTAHKEREIKTRTDGGESVQIDVFKEADANMVALSARVRQKLGEFDVEAFERRQREGPSEEEKAEAKQRDKKGRGWGGDGPKKPEPLAKQLYVNEGVLIEVVADRSIFIESSIDEVRNTAILGGLLAITVLFLFLRNFKSTAIIAVSIPISLLVTFAPLNLFGVTLNIMSLGGLALGIGMLVDSSIVVLESIFRCREEGDDVVTAAVRGTREVRGAVIASTLTSIAVFFPMVFVEGVAGQAFGDLGLAVVISLLAALVVAVAFIPMLASRGGLDLRVADSTRSRLWRLTSLAMLRGDWRASVDWLKRGGTLLKALPWLLFATYLGLRFAVHFLLEVAGKLLLSIVFLLFLAGSRLLWPVVKVTFHYLTVLPLRWIGAALEWLQRGYPRGLRWALSHPGAIVTLALALFGATAWLASRLDSELLPEVHQGELTVEVALPVGTPLEETDDVLTPVENAILAERDSIDKLLLTVGYDAASSQRSDEGEHTARFKVLLDSSDPALEKEVIARLRRRFADIPDVEARVVRPVLFSFKTPVEVEIHGDDLAQLRSFAERFREVMAGMEELADVDTTLRSGAPEVQIVYDRDRLARYDLNISQVAQLVRNAVAGFEATRFNLKDRRIPILVRFEENDRATVDDVRDLVVNPGTVRSVLDGFGGGNGARPAASESGRPIRLSSVADVRLGEGPSEVRRIDGRRVALVRANIAQGSLGAAVDKIERELRSRIDLPPDLTFFITGQSQEWERSQASLLLALGLSIFLVYVIMAAQFESLIHPLVIMCTIPLAFLGTFLALGALGISLSIVVFLGMIMLAGIVVNNAIVLVDYINTLKRRGLSRDDAVVQAGTVRLRPILMTTATTVLGLTPMALGLGDGAEIRTPMAIAVISGLIASTVLTLLIIPTLYALLDRLQGGLWGRD